MIIISGTGRSGTSLWMQALGAAGVPILGDAFPLGWADRAFREANPSGFYESTLADGINFTSHPNPATGATLDPEAHRHVACKVFLPGLGRTERRWLTRVVVSFRHYRAYQASLARAMALLRVDDASRPLRRATFHPYARWWTEHLAALTDQAQRGYPCRYVAYEDVVADPARAMAPVLAWIGVGDAAAAVGAVDPALRTVAEADAPHLPAGWEAPLDELHARMRDGTMLDPAWLARARRFDDEVQRAVAADPRKADPWAAARRR